MKRRVFLTTATAVAASPLSRRWSFADEDTTARRVMTVAGEVSADRLGKMLPHEHVMVDFVGADPNSGVYDPGEHTYTWEVGAMAKDDPMGQVVLYVEMTERAAPLTQVGNRVEVESDISFSTDTEITPVGPWGDIFYVDINAAGNDDGSSWADAFGHLEDAIAAAGYCDQIWVAKGTYEPQRIHQTYDRRQMVRSNSRRQYFYPPLARRKGFGSAVLQASDRRSRRGAGSQRPTHFVE